MKWTLEYSVIQDSFHISDLKRTIENNIRTSLSKIIVDYRIVGMFDTYEEASNAADEMRKQMMLIQEEKCKNGKKFIN